ncbi:MAG: carbohydrate-binding domain-containing protein [Eubacteriaceae bacterium]|nr:carbohydrate-binding domain-containing protein [Eubacteriaceae bacterium]
MKRKLYIWAVLMMLAAVIVSPVCTYAAQDYDTSGATYFTFTSSGITVKEGDHSGYSIEGTDLKITGSGTYVVTGSCQDGTITVKKGTQDVVLVLSGLTLSSSDSAPITCNKQSEVTIIVRDGTKNSLSDTEYNNDETHSENENAENAVIKCKDGSTVTICGSGTLDITANGKNGIKGGGILYEEDDNGNATSTVICEGSLTIMDAVINITCNANDGLKADRLLEIVSGTITVSAADDAIKCDYYLNIGSSGNEGPTINVTRSTEGIEAAEICVYSGNVTVNATDDGINAANSDLKGYSFAYRQYGGYVWVNCTNGDALDSNGTVELYGGTLETYAPSQGDGDPIDSDRGTTFGGATVLAAGHAGMRQQYNAQTAYAVFSGNTLASSGDTIEIRNESGSTLYTATAVRNLSYIVFTSPAVGSNESLSLYVNGSAVKTQTSSSSSGTAGYGPAGNGGYGPGMNGNNGPGNGQGFVPGGGQGFAPGGGPQGQNGGEPPQGMEEAPTGTQGPEDMTEDNMQEGSEESGASSPGIFERFLNWIRRIFGIG